MVFAELVEELKAARDRGPEIPTRLPFLWPGLAEGAGDRLCHDKRATPGFWR
jgi:hypothetical protein